MNSYEIHKKLQGLKIGEEIQVGKYKVFRSSKTKCVVLSLTTVQSVEMTLQVASVFVGGN